MLLPGVLDELSFDTSEETGRSNLPFFATGNEQSFPAVLATLACLMHENFGTTGTCRSPRDINMDKYCS